MRTEKEIVDMYNQTLEDFIELSTNEGYARKFTSYQLRNRSLGNTRAKLSALRWVLGYESKSNGMTGLIASPHVHKLKGGRKKGTK